MAGALLGLLVLAHLAMRWWIRVHARRAEVATSASPGTPSGRRWVTRGLTHLLPAVALLMWIHGLYFTITLLLRRAAAPAVVDPALTTVNWIYSLSVVAAIVWMLSRIGQLIEAFLLSRAARADTVWDDVLLPLAGKAIRRGLPLLALILAAPALAMSPALAEIVRNATSLLLIGTIAWVLFRRWTRSPRWSSSRTALTSTTTCAPARSTPRSWC